MFGRHHRARGAQGCGPAAEKFRDGNFGDHFGGHMGGHFDRHMGGHFGERMREHFGRHMGGNFKRPKYNVPLNIIDNETSFEVHVYAFGFLKENIKLAVTDDVLYISGTRTIEADGEPNFSRQEFPIRSFERMLNLNGQVEATDISAKQENGLLIITLPKTIEAQKPSQEIKVD